MLSQLPAIRKFWGILDGLNANEDTESSGGEVTSKSFMGLAEDGVLVDPNVEPGAKGVWLNIWNKNDAFIINFKTHCFYSTYKK